MFATMTIRARLRAAFGALLLVLLLLSSITAHQFDLMYEAADDLGTNWSLSVEMLTKYGESLTRFRQVQAPSVLVWDTDFGDKVLQARAAARAAMDEAWRAYEKEISPGEETVLADRIRAAAQAYLDLDLQVEQTIKASDLQRAAQLLATDLAQPFLDLQAAIQQDLDFNHAGLAAALARSHNVQTRALWTLGLTTALAGGIMLSVIVWLNRNVMARVLCLAEVMRRLARGEHDCAIPVPGRPDELGQMVLAVQVFRENTRQLHAAKAEIERTNQHFDAALRHMAQGLCLFAPNGALQIVNHRYFEIFRAPTDAIRPGAPFRALVEHAIASGRVLDGPPEQHVERVLAAVADGNTTQLTLPMEDGRTVAVTQCRLPDGGWVATYEDITERQLNEARITHMAWHDALTQLPNRVLFQERIEAAVAYLDRGRHFALHCLDLDRFKEVNDTLGHAAGDELLRVVAERLRGCVREVDTIARLGGDEFAVLQVDIHRPEDATVLAGRLVQVIGAPYEIAGHNVVVGTSVGIALAPEDGRAAGALLKQADMALYRAKADGRGTFRFFEPGMDTRLQARRALEMDLRRALTAEELTLFYQPLLSTAASRVTGFEALVRWRHPERGMVSPADFIPLAEETGLILQLGEWVLRRACEEAVAWPEEVKVAVNLSPVQFRNRRLVDSVADALAASGLPPRQLELEITESALLQDNDATLAILHELRALGVRISMDDFGTGYSPLSYLRQFPFDKIKIDRCFIQDLAQKEEASAIIRAITGLGSGLGMSTTAEGVETEAQLAELRLEGCTEVQGYLFSPPRPNSEVPAILDRLNGSATKIQVMAAPDPVCIG